MASSWFNPVPSVITVREYTEDGLRKRVEEKEKSGWELVTPMQSNIGGRVPARLPSPRRGISYNRDRRYELDTTYEVVMRRKTSQGVAN